MNDDYFLKWIALPVFAGIVVGLLLAIIYVLIQEDDKKKKPGMYTGCTTAAIPIALIVLFWVVVIGIVWMVAKQERPCMLVMSFSC